MKNILNLPIVFIATGKADRLLLQYSILVKQYSVSKNEYDFWDSLRKINKQGSDIFAFQPYQVRSNIHNFNNPQEMVMGYFQVSAVRKKRKDIHFMDIVDLDLPYFSYDCTRIEFSSMDYPWSKFNPPFDLGRRYLYV